MSSAGPSFANYARQNPIESENKSNQASQVQDAHGNCRDHLYQATNDDDFQRVRSDQTFSPGELD